MELSLIPFQKKRCNCMSHFFHLYRKKKCKDNIFYIKKKNRNIFFFHRKKCPKKDYRGCLRASVKEMGKLLCAEVSNKLLNLIFFFLFLFCPYYPDSPGPSRPAQDVTPVIGLDAEEDRVPALLTLLSTRGRLFC